jgi:ferredoxin-NADP reductase
MSIRFEADDGTPLPVPRPGQYLTLRVSDAGDPAPLRSYSLSSCGADYRISVKREDHGTVSAGCTTTFGPAPSSTSRRRAATSI